MCMTKTGVTRVIIKATGQRTEGRYLTSLENCETINHSKLAIIVVRTVNSIHKYKISRISGFLMNFLNVINNENYINHTTIEHAYPIQCSSET